MLATPLCTTLGIEVPVIQAPVGSATTPALAAAVTEAGGMGTLALTWDTPARAVAKIREVRRRTAGTFGVNLVLDFPVEEILTACLDEGVPLVSTFWGDPAGLPDRVHAAGALHFHTVGGVEEARRAADAGADAVVAQGWEAGGHVRGEVSTMALVPAVVDAVRPLPVVAAGGIGDGRGLAAALALGAQAGWLGTRFLTALEADTHERYRALLRDATEADTVHTRCFDGGWPDAPHRALRNATLARWEDAGCPRGPGRPGEGEVVATDRHGRDHLRYADMVPTADATGNVDEMALYAGQSVALTGHPTPAARLVSTLIKEAETTLDTLH
ncbi:NAD(P)H-dependent flavin oxidoreductase [Streptomyces daliensis]